MLVNKEGSSGEVEIRRIKSLASSYRRRLTGSRLLARLEERDMFVYELSIVSKLSLPFLLSMPSGEPGAGKQAPRPVLLFLHGYEEGAPTEIYLAVTAHGPLKPGSSPLATRDFIIAAPQLPTRGDAWSLHAKGVSEIVSYLYSECGGDPRRSYLTGFSFGGNGVFDVALHDPSLWAALWSVDPTRVPEADPGLPVWLSSGAACRPRGRGFMERLRLQPPGGGGEVDRGYVDAGLDHVGTATSAYNSDTVYQWLLSRQS